VEFMLKDSKGFLWFTSHDGINRFDGTTCHSNEQIGPGFEEGLQTKGLVEDESGNIWIGTSTGIFMFSYTTGRFEKMKPVVKDKNEKTARNYFYLPFGYANGWLLVGRDDKAPFMFNTITNETRIIPYPALNKSGDLEFERIQTVKELAQSFHTLIHNPDKVSFAKVEPNGPGEFYWKEYIIYKKAEHPQWGGSDCYFVRDSIVVVACESGNLIKFNLKTGERVVFPKINIAYPPTLYIDEHFMLWVGTQDSGVYVYDLYTNALKNHFIHDVNNEASLSKHRVQAILKTNENTVWLSIWGKGVDYARITDNGFTHHLTPSEVRRFGINNFVRGIVEAKDGKFYANTQFGGIIQLDNQLNYLKTISNQFSASIYIDPKSENIYFGDLVLFRYNLKTGRIFEIRNNDKIYKDAFQIGPVYQLSDFDKDKILAAGILRPGIIDPQQNLLSQIKGTSDLFNQVTIFAKQVKSGNVYINTSTHGLLIFKKVGDGYEKIFTFPEKFVTKHIWEENDTTHWIGTTNGLYVFNQYNLQVTAHFTTKNGLPNNVVYAMAPDTMGRLWISTNKGLASMIKATGKWSTYRNFAGTQGNEYNTNTVVTAADGRIIFGGVNGLTAIRPWEVDRNYPFPTVQITAIKGDSTYNSYKGAISVVAGDNTLEFEFIGIDFNDPSACKLRYRLIGADENWVESGNPGKARYIQLAPGNYKFEVMAANANGDWSNDVRSVEIKIAAFWWQWKWLQVLFILAAIGSVIIFARLQVKRTLYKKQVALEKELSIIRERERITADLHDDVGATLSSLNIYGDLAHTIWFENPEKSREMVGKIAGQSRELMLRMSDIIWSMKPDENGANGILPRIKNFAQELLSGKGILAEFNIDEPTVSAITNPMVRKNIILIIKEGLNNVSKYSLAVNVCISIKKEDNALLLEIKDDGKGFEKESVIMGNGLENMERRCRQMGGSFELITQPGIGTTITCKLPLAIFSYNGDE